MTQAERTILNPPRVDAADAASVAGLLTVTLKALRRHAWILAFSVAGFLTLAIISIVAMTPIYSASATIYIDPRESRGFQEAGGILLNSDALVVDSEVEILLSSSLAERVVERLGLAQAEEPVSDSPNLTARLKTLLTGGAGSEDQSGLLSPEEAAMRRAVAALQRNVEVGRLGNTYVIEITVRDPDKRMVADIANAYTAEYLKSSLDVQSDRLEQLNSWSAAALRAAIRELQTAEAAINRFRLNNQIDSDGLQVAGFELAETNAALVKLRNERFQNELLLERIRTFLSEGSTDADVPEVGAEGIALIRTQILQAEIEYARVIASGSKNSPQAAVLQRELDALKAQLVDEYERIVTQLDRQIQVSIKEEQRLAERAGALRREVSDVSGKQAELRELEMRADGERAVYQALLTRFNETSDDLAYKSNSARVLTAAHVPAGPSSPQTAKILAMALVAGTFIGLVLIFIREQFETGIRQPRDIEARGVRYLGAVPTVRWAPFRLWNRSDPNAPVLTGTRRRRERALMSFAVDFPLSEFSETVRSIVFDAAARNAGTDRAQIVAVTSSARGEGKSTLAANLAAYFAKQGKRVHLIDFDLKNPTLSGIFATRHARLAVADKEGLKPGGAEGVNKKKPAGFDFSGQIDGATASDMIEFVSPRTISTYLESVKANCDVVVLDVGSLSESSDARMCAELADYVVLAVRWGLTSVEQVERCPARGMNRSGKTMGAVLTMVPPSEKLERPAGGEQNARRLAVA